MTVDPAAVAARLDSIRRRMAAAGAPADVEVVAVTKGFGPDAVRAAIDAGCRSIGENYAQELLAKRDVLAAARPPGSVSSRYGFPPPQLTVPVAGAEVAVHFIGRLQSNKVRRVAPLVDVWETVDRPALIAELARRAPGATMLVQVNPTGERGKGGCAPDDVPGLVAAGRDAGLVVDGLMTVGPTSGGPEAARPGFRAVRALVDALGLRTCSMGMTDDLEVAIEEGTTRVRLGTALFGPRPAG